VITVNATWGEVFPVKFESPAYTAVRLCEPTEKVFVVNVRSPVALALPVATTDALSKIVIIPVGTPVVALATCAEMVTKSPEFTLLTGLRDGVATESAIVVAARVMVKTGGVSSS
jgi:hypothetical protein